jgi:hypothetical protein
MKAEQFWHMYYSGMDGVDVDESWVKEVASKEFCSQCGVALHGKEYCRDVHVLQKIPKNMDMFMISYNVGIMSVRLRDVLKDFVTSLNFGEIRLSNHQEITHYSFTPKRIIILHGTKPNIWMGKQVSLDEWPSHCPGCGTKYDRSRGQRFLYEDEVPETGDLFGDTNTGLFFSDKVYEVLSRHKLRGVRIEKILIKPRSFIAMS